MLQNPPASFAFAGGNKYISNDDYEDDEDFGDFVFSSPSSTSHPPSLFSCPTPLMHFTAGGDDDWGDFVASGPGSQFLHHQTNAPLSLPFDPFSDASPRGPLPPEPPASGTAIEKTKGPLPLSIFGEEDLEEPERLELVGDFGNGFNPPSLANHTFPNAPTVGELKDLINSLYGQAGAVNNDDVAGSTEKEKNDDSGEGGWEFKDAFSADSKDAFSADSRTERTEVNGDIAGLGMGAAEEESRGSQIVVCRLENGWKDTFCFETNGQERGLNDASAFREELTLMSPGRNHSVSAMHMHDLLSSFGNGTISLVKDDFKTEFRENAITSSFKEAERDSNALSKIFEGPSVQQILQLAPREHQLLYVNAWCKMAQACSKELHHGSKIWREALDGSFCIKLLSKGNKYFLALGEIYRASRILKASTRFYMPWLLSDQKDASEVVGCLEKCNEAWTTSGLGEVLLSLSNGDELDVNIVAKSLLESIDLIDRAVVPTFQDLGFPHGPSVCRFSLLPFAMLPDMKRDVWKGVWYFTKLANLWANLVSPHPPELPC